MVIKHAILAYNNLHAYFLSTSQDFAKKKSSKTFFVISKRFRVQRLAAQVPLDMPIFCLLF